MSATPSFDPLSPRASPSPIKPFFLACLLATGLQASEPIDFNRDIRPILSDKCFRCHGPDEKARKAHLRLDIESNAKAEVDGRRALFPERPDQSELMVRITHPDPEERMPPPETNKELNAEEIALLRHWIEAGASWSEPWACVPPRQHPLPTVAHRDWPRNWVDQFVLARLEKESLAPAQDADRVTLLRRLSFDLTGLPPTPDEVERFIADQRPQAYEALVEQFLSSPAFGERIAMYWLDLVRYADTVGYHGDQDHNISPYRDWVIEALNQNMPFDQFTRYQLAGDLVPGAGIDGKVASGYNRLLQTSHEGGVQAKEYLAIYAADRVRNLSSVWMGATLGCSQCHDHKYDPYTSRDFYSLAAFFADVDEARHLKKAPDAVPTKREPELPVLMGIDRDQARELSRRVAELKLMINTASKASAAQLLAELAETEAALAEVEKRARLTMITRSVPPRTMRILPRGNWLDETGPIVDPAVPAFLGKVATPEPRPTRLDLANWLTEPDQGGGLLTARVLANRFWYLTFGVGLARVLDDFGGQGEAPVNPELLDNLAVEFVRSGWDIKHMVRLLVTSRAYQQSSRAPESLLRRDPYNRLTARQSRFRLPAEMVRDNALTISGLLIREIGGPSVKPYQPKGYYRHLNFPARTYKHDLDQRQWRRGVYVHWQRQFLHPMLKAFDAPSREECTVERPRSNTPLAALTLLNDPTFVEAARQFATRILREGGSTDDAKLQFAFRQALSRPADDWEKQHLLNWLLDNRQTYGTDPDSQEALLKTGQAPIDHDLDPVELAAWTQLARAILNLGETSMRN